MTQRLLHGRRNVPFAFAVFDVLSLSGECTMQLPYARRRELLESLSLDGFWFAVPRDHEGPGLFRAISELGVPLRRRRSSRLASASK